MKLNKEQTMVFETVKQNWFAKLPAKKRNQNTLQSRMTYKFTNGIDSVIRELRDIGCLDYELMNGNDYMWDIHVTNAPYIQLTDGIDVPDLNNPLPESVDKKPDFHMCVTQAHDTITIDLRYLGEEDLTVDVCPGWRYSDDNLLWNDFNKNGRSLITVEEWGRMIGVYKTGHSVYSVFKLSEPMEIKYFQTRFAIHGKSYNYECTVNQKR